MIPLPEFMEGILHMVGHEIEERQLEETMLCPPIDGQLTIKLVDAEGKTFTLNTELRAEDDLAEHDIGR